MHFFIDEAALPAQTTSGTTPDMTFGPDATTPTTKFNITTQHQLASAAKAYACQKGMMVLQQNSSNTSLVNAIIKPSTPLKVGDLKVRYYVYKGLDIASFFNGSAGSYAIRADGTAGNSEFLEDFWDTMNLWQAADASTYTAPTPINFGYGSNTLPLTDAGSLAATRNIDDIFAGVTTAKAVSVDEGVWFGNFQSAAKIGFVIVMEDETKVPFTLNEFRMNAWTVETGTHTGFALKKKKEHILSFIDPAAFWGMHYKNGLTGVDTARYSGTTKINPLNRTIPGSLFTGIVDKYANKHRIYVDIRSERGRSYNYYNSYKISGTDPKNIRLNGANDAAALEYGTNGWPLLIVTTDTAVNSKKNKFTLRLRRDTNTDPVLYFPNKFLTYKTDTVKKTKRYYAGSDIKESATTDWTKDFTIYYPHNNNSAKDNLATYMRLYYFLNVGVNTGTDRPWNSVFYDSAFCNIDLGKLGVTTVTNSKVESPHPTFVREALQTNGTGNFAFAAKTGAFWDSTRVLFYCAALPDKQNNTEKDFLPTFDKRLDLTNTKYTTFKNQFKTICREYKRSDAGTPVTFKILGINEYRVSNKLQEKEDLLLLGITSTELTTVKAAAGLSDEHPRHVYLVAASTGPLFDTTTQHHRYYKATIHVQGVNATTGVPTRVATTVEVYTRDCQFWHSQAFATGETLSDNFTGLNNTTGNRIEYHLYHDGKIKISDNIDLALVRKSTIQDEHNTQADNSLAGDTSQVQKLHYIWHPASTATPNTASLIASFDVVMANKMKKHGSVSSIPQPEYTQKISYTSGDYKQTWENGDGHLISNKNSTGTGGTKLKYKNQGKKLFLVHFVTALTASDTNKKKVFMSGDSTPANNNNTLGLKFTYSNTRRRYANPSIAAATLGALIRDQCHLTSTGFAFGDGSSAPSKFHVNGFALDNSYFGLNGGAWTDDKDFIVELDRFGFRYFRIGYNRTTLDSALTTAGLASSVKQDGAPSTPGGNTLHDNHLHSEFIDINE